MCAAAAHHRFDLEQALSEAVDKLREFSAACRSMAELGASAELEVRRYLSQAEHAEHAAETLIAYLVALRRDT